MRGRISCSNAALFLLVTHLPFFSASYFWDEAGQFIPASLDLFRFGDLVPHSTLPNVHPPGVMLYLAAAWRIFGYSIVTTRLSMLLIAVLACWCTWRLAADFLCPDRKAATMTLVLLCLSPLFFSQSIMTLLDMPAMAFTLLALLLFFQERIVLSAVACIVLVMVKETGALLPAVLGITLIQERRWKQSILFVLPALPLFAWLILLHARTGNWFGNAVFARYNLSYPLNPVRFVMALLRRGYYLFIGTGYFIGSIALWKSRGKFLHSRAWRVSGAFFLAHVLAMCLLGGAVLERYLLPVLPLSLAAFAAARPRMAAFIAMCAISTACIFINPVYPFPLENNLAWIDYVDVQADAARYLSSHLPSGATLASSFPFAGCMRFPELGYTTRRFTIDEIPDFSPTSVATLRGQPIDAFVIFSSTWDRLGIMSNSAWVAFLRRFYNYHPDLSPDQIPAVLGMHSVIHFARRGQWIDIFVP